MKRVFIIGNGFDLNLGWKTGYRDFVESQYCPIENSGSSLSGFLAEKTMIDRWFDLEAILRSYASVDNKQAALPGAIWSDEKFFYQLREGLNVYLKNEMTRDVDTHSDAIAVLRSIVNSRLFGPIYSFNYTNLNQIAKQAGIHTPFSYSSVHGSIDNDSIILGIDDKTEVRKGYAFLRKVFNEHYKSHPIRYDLQECKEVVIFGHSLGDNDYPYFRDFFKAQSQCVGRNSSKKITIFTKDNRSRMQILEQLRVMNDCATERLINDNDFTFVMTDSDDKTKLNEFLSHIDKESKRKTIHVI